MNKIEKFKQIAGKKWYIQGFNSSMNYIVHGAYSGLVGNHKCVGYGYTQMLFIFQKEYLEYHYLEKDFEDIGNEFMKRFVNDPDYLNKLLKKNDELMADAFKVRAKVEATDFSNLNKKQTLALYHEMAASYMEFIGVGHIIEGISYVLEPLLKEKLEERFKLDRHDKKFREIFNDLSQPERLSFANLEHLDIMKLMREIMKDETALKLFKEKSVKDILEELKPELKKLISVHQKKYFYNQLNYFHGESLTDEEYTDEIRKLFAEGIDVDAKIKEEEERYKTNIKRRDEIINEYNLDKDTQHLIKLLIDVLHWQDDRKKYILMGVFYMNKTLKEVANKYNIPHEMLKRYFPMELTEEKLDDFDKDDANDRIKNCVVNMWRENNGFKFEVFTKDDYNEFMDIYLKTFAEHNDIHGTCASTGKASGYIRVCKTKDDIAKFKEGEILVAAMTRPEFVPAMRKSAAIVTDEGGITCHAAIVSRELGKPCIIGTKIATKVLKDGVFVEVNANHGTVKLEKKE